MRLGITPDEIAAGHCVALSRPKELADMLVGHADAVGLGDSSSASACECQPGVAARPPDQVAKRAA